MSLLHLAVGLWRRSWPFKVLVAAAVGMTALTLASVSMPGGGGGQVSPPPPSPPVPAKPKVAQLPAQCDAAGGLQSPMVVGNQVPGNVTAVAGPQTGVPLDTQARFNRFLTLVDAAAGEPRLGEHCVRMQDPISLLEPQDYAYAECFLDGAAKLVQAQKCAQDFAASQARFERLADAAAAAASDGSAPQVEKLAQARAALVPFDETRERWKEAAEQVAAGDRAANEIAASDARIAELERAAGAAKGDDVAGIAALAKAAALASLDLGRLDPSQKNALDQARAAATRVAESDDRLAALSTALTTTRAGEAGGRQALIGAVSGLQDFDAARATPAQRAEIDAARSEAASFALEDLTGVARVFDATTAPPAQFQQLADLASVVTRYGGVVTPNPEQQAALEKARAAAAALATSDQRLQAMRDTMAAVDKGGPAALGQQVLEAYNAIGPFETARMSDADLALFDKLAAARDVTTATERQVLTRSVPIFVRANTDDVEARNALNQLQDQLRAAGYQLVNAEEQSAVKFDLSASEMDKRTVSVGTLKVETAEIDLTLTGAWTFAGSALPVQRADGIGRGHGAEMQAVETAVAKLVEAIDELAEQPHE